MADNMKVYSFALDQETVDRIIDLQKKTGVFSRSEMVRKIINEALDNKEKVG